MYINSNVTDTPLDLQFIQINEFLWKYEGTIEFTESTDITIHVDCGRNQIATTTIPVFVNDPALADTDEDGCLLYTSPSPRD